MRSATSMQRSGLHSITALVTTALIFSAPALAGTIDFEDFLLDSSGFYNGSDLAGDFTSGGASFNNNFTDFGGGCCWDGWSVSNLGDTTSAGFSNQYSSFAGGGFGGGGRFGVLFTDSGNISLGNATEISGTYLTNTTFSALSMRDGDAFAKKFGGVSGTDPDWFNVTLEGFLGGVATQSVVFYLADFRPAGTSNDFIIDAWTWVDLSSLGLIDELRFHFDSSDRGAFGINTPTYAAVDNLVAVVPEPSTAVLLCIGGLILGQSIWRKPR